MPTPVNKELYEQVKKEVYAKYQKPSAYRSALLVKTYKERGGTYKGKEKQTEGLNKWFSEKWLNERGEVGYKYKNDIYRPTVRITKNTPTTIQELTPVEREKKQKDRNI